MQFFGLGLHTIVAIFFAIHALRTGREIYWLFILFLFPLLGSIVYFIVIYLPELQQGRGLRTLTAVAAQSLDPGRELREARAAFELTATVQNRIRVANALIAHGEPGEAAQQYEECLAGPLARDPEVRLGAARAHFAAGHAARTEELLRSIRSDQAEFRAEEVALLLARALAAQGKDEAARAEFEVATNRFGGIESRVEYAIWAHARGDQATARRLREELDQSMRHWSSQTRVLNRPIVDRLEAAFRGGH